MKLESAIKKIEKRLPDVPVFGITGPRPGAAKRGLQNKYSFCYNGKVATFYSDHDGHARGFHIRRADDHSDSMTDYFAGSFYDNCTQMLNVLDPPGPKFPIGSLVKGKNNKRADRHGMVGRIGLVTKVTTYGCYDLLMSDTGLEERYAYERDLEIA